MVYRSRVGSDVHSARGWLEKADIDLVNLLITIRIDIPENKAWDCTRATDEGHTPYRIIDVNVPA